VRDSFNREITYLRISVTDRCNLRCFYCMPREGIRWIPHERILSFEEITAFVRVAVSHGITKVRLTGGEPLVRAGITDLVAMIAAISGVRDLALTTNGVLLAEAAPALKKAGLMRINVSLDTINRERFVEITGSDLLDRVLAGIAAARAAGFPLKINTVVEHTPDEPDAREVAAWAAREGIPVRFIPRMDLAEGHFFGVMGGTGGDCPRCNRLRLLADGTVKPCLFSDFGFPLRAFGPEEALRRAVAAKPAHGTRNTRGSFHNIGG